MNVRRPIGHRLATVAVMGVVTAALSGVALYRAISVTTALRLERARDAAAEELTRLTAEPRDPEVPDDRGPAIIGMRGGVAAGPEQAAARVPEGWRAPLRALIARGLAQGGPAQIETPVPGATLVARAVPAPPQGLAWVAIAVRPSPYLQSWRILVVALTIAAMLLVASAAYSLVTVKRGAGQLLGAMSALVRDLSAPVPRPRVRELADIADGIASLAGHLAEARQIQERLGRDLARQERLVALGRVVAGVAHEVRNPLASIKLRLDLAMVGDTPLPQSATHAIAHASAEIARLDRLVADLLIVSGRALGPRAPADVMTLLRARTEALAPWAAVRGVALVATGTGTAPVDADALARALDNLLRNAIEASPVGEMIEAWASDDGDQVRVCVQDRGPGVPPGRAGELFEPFFTTKSDGTGLGLAISRAIARAHGGDVVYAREGSTTRFELTVSRARGDDSMAAREGAG